MERYSCSYGNTKGNFVICNMEGFKDNSYDPMEDKFYGIYCVVQNIIQRGTPTKPSFYLKSKLGEISPNISSAVYLISRDAPDWIDTIKGDDKELYYPAKEFFYSILPKYLGDYAFVQRLMLPEAYISDILKATNKFDSQQVDFYLPQAHLVIEIDGGSHNISSQVRKDSLRDSAFKSENIRVIRIATTDIRNVTPKLKNTMKQIYDLVQGSPEINQYKKALEGYSSDESLRIKYDSVIRLQMLFFTLLRQGTLKLTDDSWRFSILSSDIEEIKTLFNYAYDDIKDWIYVIAKLKKNSLTIPQLEVIDIETPGAINIDFSIFKGWTDECSVSNKCIYIRKDYYDNKNYYRIANSDTIQYKIQLEGAKSDLPELKFILKNLFGFEEFRDGQLPIIINTLEGNDTIGILPTGAGKSLCYQYAAMLQPGISLSVVPIISLMQDQKLNMDSIGMTRTAYISGGQVADSKEAILEELSRGCYKLVWISPERFQNIKFRQSLGEVNKQLNFALAVIDEVHCLSEWGHDFRVSYLTLIRTIRNYCPEARLLGLTATASQAVLVDLKNEFEIDDSDVKALSSMNRDELVFKRINVPSNEDKFDYIEQILLELKGFFGVDVLQPNGEASKCGLVFCLTKRGREGCIEFAEKFTRKFKKRIGLFHGDMTLEEKSIAQTEFINNNPTILACTKAFGMGINKKNIKYTIHYGVPPSIEAFYQEAGRAGRDENKNEKSYCYILAKLEACSREIIARILSPNTTPDERKELCRTYLKNDISTIMFLWNLNRHTVDEEIQIIKQVFNRIYNDEIEIPFNSQNKHEIEMALYKLSLLGVVADWTVEYASLTNGTITVIYNGYDEESIRQHLLKYIRKYDVEFSLDNYENKRYVKYVEIMKTDKKPMLKYVRILIEWVNDNILDQRLQSTLNMMELCYPEIDEETFRNRLENYFRYSEVTIAFDEIAYHPKEYARWFSLLYVMDRETQTRKSIISKRKAESMLGSLQRYLESYRNNTGLNYMSGILRMISNQYAQTEGEERFRDAWENIKQLQETEIKEILEETLNIGQALDMDNKILLSKVVCECLPDKRREVFNKLKDPYSLTPELEKALNRLNDIRGRE